MTAGTAETTTLSSSELALIDAYWRAANYCRSARSTCSTTRCCAEPLGLEHIKPRLLGHWGTTPGLNLVYAHMNRLIRARDLERIFIAGPGHGGPGVVANAYLEGTYSEVYPRSGRTPKACGALFRQFSFPGGIPSHVAPETPGSIHEGGELGYALAARLRCGVRQPRSAGVLRHRRRRGGDRAARGELAFEQVPQSRTRRRGAADPASERLQDREPDGAGPDPAAGVRRAASTATVTPRTSSRATNPRTVHRQMAAALDAAYRRDPRHPAQRPARRRLDRGRAGR